MNLSHRYLLVLFILVCSCSHHSRLNTSDISFRKGKSVLVKLCTKEPIEFIWVDKLQMWAGKYEITFGQFGCFPDIMTGHPSNYVHYEGRENHPEEHPAIMVSWAEARNFADKLNELYEDHLPKEYIFRLPNEAEWEFLAHCGDKTIYPWGNEWPPIPMSDGLLPNLQGQEVLSYKKNGKEKHGRSIPNYYDGWAGTCPVKKSGMNKLGLCGMAGNVQEWVEGWYNRENLFRLLKGSSYSSFGPSVIEISFRYWTETNYNIIPPPFHLLAFLLTTYEKNTGYNTTGFRLVLGKQWGSDKLGMGPRLDRLRGG